MHKMAGFSHNLFSFPHIVVRKTSSKNSSLIQVLSAILSPVFALLPSQLPFLHKVLSLTSIPRSFFSHPWSIYCMFPPHADRTQCLSINLWCQTVLFKWCLHWLSSWRSLTLATGELSAPVVERHKKTTLFFSSLLFIKSPFIFF